MNFKINGFNYEIKKVIQADIKCDKTKKEGLAMFQQYEGKVLIPKDEEYKINLDKLLIHELAHAYICSSGCEKTTYTEEEVCNMFEAYAEEIINIKDKYFKIKNRNN